MKPRQLAEVRSVLRPKSGAARVQTAPRKPVASDVVGMAGIKRPHSVAGAP